MVAEDLVRFHSASIVPRTATALIRVIAGNEGDTLHFSNDVSFKKDITYGRKTANKSAFFQVDVSFLKLMSSKIARHMQDSLAKKNIRLYQKQFLGYRNYILRVP